MAGKVVAAVVAAVAAAIKAPEVRVLSDGTVQLETQTIGGCQLPAKGYVGNHPENSETGNRFRDVTAGFKHPDCGRVCVGGYLGSKAHALNQYIFSVALDKIEAVTVADITGAMAKQGAGFYAGHLQRLKKDKFIQKMTVDKVSFYWATPEFVAHMKKVSPRGSVLLPTKKQLPLDTPQPTKAAKVAKVAKVAKPTK